MRTELKVGSIYHWLGYEDDELSRPMVTSMEYLGLDILKTEPAPDGPRHFFRMLGSEEKVMFARNNLPELVGVAGLIEQLRKFESGKHKRPPEASVATLKAIAAAFNAHDLDAIMEFFADDCSLDMPRGRIRGANASRAKRRCAKAWRRASKVFRTSTTARTGTG